MHLAPAIHDCIALTITGSSTKDKREMAKERNRKGREGR
jgi:hypothetical protein